jgi:hypothetical protein
MAASTYKIWAIGQPLNNGVSGSIHVGLAAIAKKANAGEPNIVINELLCNLLARSLFLPCPPGCTIGKCRRELFLLAELQSCWSVTPAIANSVSRPDVS